MPNRKHYSCAGCGNQTEHGHFHDCAHGIAETHIAGTERFECKTCHHVVHVYDVEAKDFDFIFDVPPKTKTLNNSRVNLMPNSEMIELVAKAIAKQQGYEPTINFYPWYDQARAAISAMREPTDRMLRAGNVAALDTTVLMDDTRFSCERATYAAMIDAALTTPERIGQI